MSILPSTEETSGESSEVLVLRVKKNLSLRLRQAALEEGDTPQGIIRALLLDWLRTRDHTPPP